MVAEVVEPDAAASEKSVVPVPLKAIMCVPPPALSVIVTAPVRVPPAVGLNVTAIVQVPSGFNTEVTEHVVPEATE